MRTQFSAMPKHAEKLGTRYSQILDDGYLCSEATKNRTNLTTKFVMAAALAFSCSGTIANGSGWQKLPESKVVWHERVDGAAPDDVATIEVSATESSISRSEYLQKQFGFKTAQWAAVLNVERKTLYNWLKNPDTSVQKRVSDRIDVLADFIQDIDVEHLNYIPKLAFGRYLDRSFSEHLQERPLDLDLLRDDYYRLYAEFDGFYKRDKHSRVVS